GEKFVINPTYKEREIATLDIFASGTGNTINMMEVAAKEASEEDLLEALKIAETEIQKLNSWQENIIREFNPQKIELLAEFEDAEFAQKIRNFLKDKLEDAIFAPRINAKDHKIAPLKEELKRYLEEIGMAENFAKAETIFNEEVNLLVHKKIIEEGIRPDGRASDEIRPIDIMLGFLPRTHGSAIFSRGNTRSLSVVTLGAPGDILLVQGMEVTGEKRFLHHYNFPPYSTGEAKSLRGPGRREIGHGALVEKALLPLIPSKEEFPYTIRVVSEILSSNGSTSMASVCSSSLALMDAGVPIKKHAAGIAMGLMSYPDGRYRILTDIQGPEDHHGDMDCKIAGTRSGITAIQMDMKIEGVTIEVLKEIFLQAKRAREEILTKMERVILQPRSSLSPFAPRVISIQIPQDKIREVIGPGGKIINTIISETGATIDIEESGLVFITGETQEAAKKAVEWIKNITREFKVGELLYGKITKIFDFGAVVELLPGHEGLVHISELAPYHVARVED
ncbi:MAG: polyribonucleotide nucleotidyltransferase, partial [Candidatus Paceibacteria bacterium]